MNEDRKTKRKNNIRGTSENRRTKGKESEKIREEAER